MTREKAEQLWVGSKRGAVRPATNEEILEAARIFMSRRVRRGVSMTSPQLVKEFLSVKLDTLEHESFCVLLLDLCEAWSNVDLSSGIGQNTALSGFPLHIK